MHYTAAIEQFQKHLGSKKFKEVPYENIQLDSYSNSYTTDSNGNIVGLNLSKNKVQNFDFIAQIGSLRSLNLRETGITDITFLEKMPFLEALNLGKNKEIKNIGLIQSLKNLKLLSLTEMGLKNIDFVEGLDLEELYFSANQISDISVLKNLQNLKRLAFNNNKVSAISALQNLYLLRFLSCYQNQLQDISPLKDLKSLQGLILSNNQIQDISPLKDLTSLQGLVLSQNQIQDISPLKDLTSLTDLRLSNNQIQDISPLKDLKSLTNLGLDQNKIQDISPLKDLKSLTGLLLNGNPIKDIPSEYWQNGFGLDKNKIQKLQAIIKEIERNSSYIFEAKMVLVGEPAAGKTSLSKKIQNPHYALKKGAESETMTRGIEVSQWSFPYANPKQTPVHEGFEGNFTAHIFDFGGQDIMHATHRYFLSRRTLYVLVADTRPEDTDFYYWLNIIELFGDHSPVIIVMNDKHNVHKDVPKHIVEQFAHLIGNRIFYVNLGNNKGLTDLVNCIQHELQSLSHVGTEKHPKTWVDIRKTLDKKWVDTVWDKIQIWKNTKEKKHYLSRQEYLDIAESMGITNEEKALQIAETLHTLGSVLYFQDNDALVDTIILNKHWATEAVYLVLLDKEVAQNHGKFTPTQYRRIWKDKYPTEKHNALIALMLAFKIAYRVQNTDTYIAPQLLPENPPQEYDTFWAKEAVFTHFEYRYPKFMPKGLLSRLIIELNQKIKLPFQWRYGVILEIQDCFVEINEHRYGSTQKLTIRTEGKEPLKAMSVVFDKMQEIHSEFPNLVYEEMIPCNCVKCKEGNSPNFYENRVLQEFLEEGEPKIQCVKSKKMVEVQVLLEGYQRFNLHRKHEIDELRNHIDNLEIDDFFEKFGDIIEDKDKVLFETLREEYMFGKFSFEFYKRAKVLVGKYR